MTSRERVTAAIEFGGPDRVPFTHILFPGALWNHGQRLIDLMMSYPDDFGNHGFTIPPDPGRRVEEYVDEWGVTWRRSRGYTVGEVSRPALEDWSKLGEYRLPEVPRDPPFDAARLAHLKNPDRDWYALDGWFNLFERLRFIRGAENALCDLAEDRNELHELADRIVGWNLACMELYISAGVDGVFIGDDWGTQQSMMVSPECWREFFKPRYRRMFELLRDAGKHVFFHSCGHTAEIWDDLIELGASVLNIQHPIIPDRVVVDKLVGKVCVFSDPDRQHVLPFGSPDEVREHIGSVVSLLATPKGGLMHRGELAPDWPFENIRAMYKAYAEFGPC